MRNMTHSNVWHDAFECVTRLLRMCDMHYQTTNSLGSSLRIETSSCTASTSSSVWPLKPPLSVRFAWGSSLWLQVACLVRLHAWTCVVREQHGPHIQMSHVTHSNESCHTFKWVTFNVRVSPVTHSNESCHTFQWVMSHVRMSHVTRSNESCHIYEVVTSRYSDRSLGELFESSNS